MLYCSPPPEGNQVAISSYPSLTAVQVSSALFVTAAYGINILTVYER